VKASTKCIQGGIAVANAGFAAPGTTAVGLVAFGVFEDTADNSSGAGGAINARVSRGCFKFGNSSAGDAIAQADVGKDVYIVDDQTVALTNGTNTRSRAGKVTEIDSRRRHLGRDRLATDVKGPVVANAAGAPTQAEFNALTNALRSLGIIS
jgi:hypothetical protein